MVTRYDYRKYIIRAVVEVGKIKFQTLPKLSVFSINDLIFLLSCERILWGKKINKNSLTD